MELVNKVVFSRHLMAGRDNMEARSRRRGGRQVFLQDYKTARLIIRSGGELNPDSECQNADGDWVKCSPGQG